MRRNPPAFVGNKVRCGRCYNSLGADAYPGITAAVQRRIAQDYSEGTTPAIVAFRYDIQPAAAEHFYTKHKAATASSASSFDFQKNLNAAASAAAAFAKGLIPDRRPASGMPNFADIMKIGGGPPPPPPAQKTVPAWMWGVGALAAGGIIYAIAK